jgi:hypothetical protein
MGDSPPRILATFCSSRPAGDRMTLFGKADARTTRHIPFRLPPVSCRILLVAPPLVLASAADAVLIRFFMIIVGLFLVRPARAASFSFCSENLDRSNR